MTEPTGHAKREEKILEYWKDHKIFEKSLEKKSPKGEFVFYDGPPFATGLPHYGHILPGTIKDVIPRYKTMRGYRVPRKWGWDCHGLPIENLIEKELGLETKKDIEKFGIAEFNKRARQSVLRFEKEWKEIIPRTGRWVDMDHAYKTMDSGYTESVWWSFKKLFDKDLIYQGFKSMHLCPRCETTLSNFEVNQGYKDIVDLTVTAKFELIDEPGTFLLAWTTTPWTLPGNVALAVNTEITYVKYNWAGANYILAKNIFHKYPGHTVEEISGKNLIGKKYKTLFDYYFKEAKIVAADFVSAEEGTGIVHIAPAFGEDDYELSLKEKLPFIQHVGTDGRFKQEVRDFAGELVKPKDDPSDTEKNHQVTDIKIIKYLAGKNLLFSKEKITHSYPHCWRCDTPLLNYAASSWFVRVTDIKSHLLKNNQKVRWLPGDIRDGRFGKWLEGARDWAVSRSRFWGASLPVWQTKDGSKRIVVDSLETLRKYSQKSGNKYFIMRHGEAVDNAKNIADPKGDPNNHLTDHGKKEIELALDKLKNMDIDLIFTSPFLRTKETAEEVRLGLKLEAEAVTTDDRLHEFNESDNSDVRKRVADFIFEVENKYSGKNILIISHGNPLWILEQIADWRANESFVEKEMLETAEVRDLPFVRFPHNENFELDLHRPFIDEVVLENPPASGAEGYRRIPEVFDTWYDSGSVPFASRAARDYRPADFIAEGLDQTRGWFYTLMVLSTALFDDTPFKHVVVNGLVLAEDGKKMSKRLKNYPELTDVLNKYGADALRFYLVASPAVRAEDIAFSEKGLDEVVKKIINRLENMVGFYELYKDNVQPTTNDKQPVHILDKWIDARFKETARKVTESLEAYKLDEAARPINDFIDDLSTWYLRRSRTRPEALPKLRQILIDLAKIMAPFTPFMSEEIYLRLRSENSSESVHLEDWPETEKSFFEFFGNKDREILEKMEMTRKFVSLALEARAKAGIKTRQPLSELRIKNNDLGNEYLDLIKDELNIKQVVKDSKLKDDVRLDIELTSELIEEGKFRDIIRAIQEERKEKGLKPGEKMMYKVPEDLQDIFSKYGDEIKKLTNIELTN